MGGQFHTDQIEKLLLLVCEGGNVAEDIAKDKGGTLSKLSHLTALVDELMALGSLDLALFEKQITELDAEDKARLQQVLKAKFDLDDDVLEEKVETGLALVLEAGEFVTKTIAFVQSLKKAPAA